MTMAENSTMTQTHWKTIFSRDVLGYDEDWINFIKKEKQEQGSMDPWWFSQSAPWSAELDNFYWWKEKFSRCVLRLPEGKWGWISSLCDFYHISPRHPYDNYLNNIRYDNWYNRFCQENPELVDASPSCKPLEPESIIDECITCGAPGWGGDYCDYCIGDRCLNCGDLGCGASLCQYCRRHCCD